MNILKYAKKISVLATTFALLQVGTVSADPADDLKAALEKGVYTIRYENVTPPKQNETMKGKTRLIQSGSWYQSFQTESDFEDPYARYYVITGVATSDGPNRYYEYSVEREDDTTAENFEYVWYATPNLTVAANEDDETLADETVFPTSKTLSKCDIYSAYDDETLDYTTTLWKKLKAY